MKNEQLYTLNLSWTGEQNHPRNERLYKVQIAGKPDFEGSADKIFKGNPSLYNPEDLLLASLSACHMMSYFYVCKQNGVEIEAYEDNPLGTLQLNPNGSGQFKSVVLRPTIIVKNRQNIALAKSLHKQAGELCFIANSVNFNITYEVEVGI